MSIEKRAVSSARSLRRGDALAVDQSLQTGNLVRLKDPKMLSLVGLPANQAGFKVLRSDQGETPMNNPVIRRTRRSEVSPVLRLAFPAGTEETEVAEALKNYGMSGYRVEQVDGVFTATRADLQSISKDTAMEIKLNEAGLVATVTRAAAPQTNPDAKPFVTMAALEFDPEKFTAEEVKRWATEKSVDGEVQEPQNAGECYVVRRSATPENEEIRRMTLDDGVTAVIVRSDDEDVPSGYVSVVNESAYGNWGWGQLDFAARLADKAFSEQMEESLYSLKSVLNEILLYSSLPLDVRKDLVMRALAQFGEYVGAVMDSLPRQLLVSVTRSATPTKEKVMSKETSGAAPTQAAVEVENKEAPLTRADIEAMVATAVTTAVAALAPKVETPAAVVAPAAEAAPLTRSDLAAVFVEAVKPITDRLEKLEGETVVRSAAAAEAKAVEKEEVKDIFRGALPGVARRK